MTQRLPARLAGRLGDLLEPEANPAGVVYGVLAIGTLIAAEGARRETYPSVIEASGLALVLYWLAHAYARHFGERLEQQKEPAPFNVMTSFVHEAALLEGAVLPVVALAVSWLAGLTLATGTTVAVWTAGVELLVLETLAGLRRRLPARDLALEVAAGTLLGAGTLGVRVLLH